MTEDMIRHYMQNLATYYQNIVNVDGSIIKRELLTRLPLSEHNSDMDSFFEKLTPKDSITISLRQIELAAQIYDKTNIVCSINVDNYAWLNDDSKNILIDKCKSFSQPIILEFTELRPMPPVDEINSVFLELKRQGVKLALDDFGTGLNGISVFADYDFDIVKIDRKLTLGIEKRPQKLKVLSHILNLLNVLDKEHIVEGVEDRKQFNSLTEIGFINFQVFFFHKPAPIEELL